MIIFLIYSLVLCWANVSNSNVTIKFAQLHYFLSQNVGGTKDIMPPCPKVGGTCPPVPPFKIGPWPLLEKQICTYQHHLCHYGYFCKKLQFSLPEKTPLVRNQ